MWLLVEILTTIKHKHKLKREFVESNDVSIKLDTELLWWIWLKSRILL